MSFHFLIPAPFLPSLPSSLQHFLASLDVLCNRKYPSGNPSCHVQLQLYFRLLRLQLSSTNFQVQLLAVLPDFSGFNCLFSYIQVQLLSVLPDYSKYSYFLHFFYFSKSTGFFGVFIWLSTSNYLA
jgi:hypothetical protein